MLQSTQSTNLNNSSNSSNSSNSTIPTNPHHIAIQYPENTCFNCLQEKQVHKIRIPTLGHGSKFKFFSTRLNLCPECLKQTNLNWWKLEIVEDNIQDKNCWYSLRYKYEKEILEFINQMPIEGRELFYARFGNGANADHMSGQDWIDYQLDRLSHEKCKLYGCFSPDEIKSYDKRFPICDKVKKVIYEGKDENKKYIVLKLRCPFGVDDNRTHSQCYECKLFVERNGEIEIMDIDDFEIYELENELALKIMLKELRNNKNTERNNN